MSCWRKHMIKECIAALLAESPGHLRSGIVGSPDVTLLHISVLALRAGGIPTHNVMAVFSFLACRIGRIVLARNTWLVEFVVNSN
jgi:hypothetical protein